MNLAELNSQQRGAIEAGEGPLMIIAGPGTGKTKTLVSRIAYLLSQGMAADSILALTFTNKAAHEMQERVARMVDDHNAQPRMTTFHALCHDLIREATQQDIQFIAGMDRQEIIKKLQKSRRLTTLSARELGTVISRLKNITPDDPIEPDAATLVADYNAALRAKSLFDFDDLLLQAYDLCRVNFHSPWRYVFVDEFQDTNMLQYELMKLFAPHGNLCVIGDPRQSIYGFRGASGGIFERFKHDFPAARTIQLTQNYRSVPAVIRLANAVFPKAEPLLPVVQDAGHARTVEVLTDYCEAEYIVTAIETALGGTNFQRSHAVDQAAADGQHFRDFAILYRSRRGAMVVQKLIAESGIPFQVVGEGSPYESPGVQQIVHKLRLLGGSPQPLRECLDEVMQKIDLPLTTDVQQFLVSLERFASLSISDFLRHIDEISDQGFYDPRADAVTLSTIHASKGLEFVNVFLIACEDDILPHKNADIDEEKRLFYVAVTRAKQKLYLLHAQKRRGQPAHLSRFIDQLPPSVVEHRIDPAMQAQKRRRQKRAIKRAQQTLF